MTSTVLAALAAASPCLQAAPATSGSHRAGRHHARPHGHGSQTPHGHRHGVAPAPAPAPVPVPTPARAPDGPVNVPIQGDGRFDDDHDADETPQEAQLVAPAPAADANRGEGALPTPPVVESAAFAPPPGGAQVVDDAHGGASSPVAAAAHTPSAHNANAATRFGVWHTTPPGPGTAGAAFVQAEISGGGTIVGTSSSSSLYQAGLSLRAAYVVHPKVFVALDLALGGGGGTAPGVDRVAFDAGAAAGLVLPLHPRLVALPSLGLGYNLWYAQGPGPRRPGYVKHALQLDLRAGLASPITPRWSLIVTPYLRPNLVHGGGGPADGLHLSLGLSAGVVCWL